MMLPIMFLTMISVRSIGILNSILQQVFPCGNLTVVVKTFLVMTRLMLLTYGAGMTIRLKTGWIMIIAFTPTWTDGGMQHPLFPMRLACLPAMLA